MQTSGVSQFLASDYGLQLLNGFLNAGLGLIMSDLNAFTEFTIGGAYSGAQNLTLQSFQGLDVGVETLIQSAVRQDHNYQSLVNGLGLGITIP